MNDAFPPGFAQIHANRLETLRDLAVTHLHDHPLDPLEHETVLIQSNGMAQWLKLAFAAEETPEAVGCGIAAAQRFVLPQSFLWQCYRAVLGPTEVPETSPFDKERLQWRIYRLLPGLLDTDPETFVPLIRFLTGDTDQRKRHQLARRLADLYDQYQVYRPDWLADWLEGRDALRNPRGETLSLAADQQWQPGLWRALHADMGEAARRLSRPGIQTRFIAALDAAEPGHFAALPRRVTVFGITSMPRPVLEALHALSRHTQILQLIQNPSGYFWADLIEDRELLRLDRQRHPRRTGTPGHPLLAAWGKQGRDFIGLLAELDEPERYRGWFQSIDLFEPPIGDTTDIESAPLLQQLQQDIYALTPLPAPGEERPLGMDDSIRFHRAHSRQREVEVLHDRLLDAFERADREGRPLRPRDIIVMVPDVDAYAPAVEAVFGTVDSRDARYIPYTIGDRRSRSEAPVAAALARLSDLPNARLTLGDVLDLLEVAPFRRRFGLAEDDVALLRRWCREAGIRWGLDGQQRQRLDLPGAFEQNSWRFGLRRLLLGYAVGSGDAWQGVEPYPEVGSLDAALLGPLRALLDTLENQMAAFSEPGRPSEWAERVETLLADCFALEATDDLALEARMTDALRKWVAACEEAQFDEPVPLAVARDAWLGALEDEGPTQRFLAGRVNICTMMPMRSIPFRMVCLLGMNEGDYPRTRPPADFDLMAASGQYRPGDRSGREDDRYLFLEALLAARERLHLSWIGRNPRDDSELPPSVLVSQLRDHLDRGWRLYGPDGNRSGRITASTALTVDHPLQPFSARYTGEGEYFTYAREWETAAIDEAALPEDAVGPDTLPPAALSDPHPISLRDLSRFLRDPAGHFLAERLKLRFDETGEVTPETEPFELDGLDAHALNEALLAPLRQDPLPDDPAAAIETAGERLRRAGRLPVGGMGHLLLDEARNGAQQAAARWQRWMAEVAGHEPAQELQLLRQVSGQVFRVEDWATGICRLADGRLVRLILKAGDTRKDGNPHYPRLIPEWLAHVAMNAGAINCETIIVGHDGEYPFPALDTETATERLDWLLAGWLAALERPLPLPQRTVFRYLAEAHKKPLSAESIAPFYEGNPNQAGEVDYAGSGALRRCFPDAASLLEPGNGEETLFAYWAARLHQPLIDHLGREGEG
ncbi:exodeoxyribonuclease V subunit gamma [Spiribacter onubensis]|uniref:RecBCD enzyme subunit RecC n=1 Tax=Spiribacter onubensis TaxID=3122420 RepID=A0ABV3S770_9GAMM